MMERSRLHTIYLKNVFVPSMLSYAEASVVLIQWVYSKKRSVAVRRRAYYVASPNEVWHIDGYHKNSFYNMVFCTTLSTC